MTATNDGQVSLHDVDVTDPMTGLSAIDCTPTAPATLASGDSMTCTATYTVTQADVDNGQHRQHRDGRRTRPGGRPGDRQCVGDRADRPARRHHAS